MKYPHARLLVFSKAPVPGQVKTRLVPLLGKDGAARLYGGWLEDCLVRVCGAALCPVQLHCAPDTTHDLFRRLRDCHDVTTLPQSTGDLGARMGHALHNALTQAGAAVLIGVDCPELPVSYLEQALTVLMAGTDVVLGPALDGGYYLIGLRRPVPDLFTGIPWGSGGVLELTRLRVRQLGLSLYCLPVCRDIDTPDDYLAWRRAAC